MRAGSKWRAPGAQRLGVAAAFRDMVGQRAAGIDAAHIQRTVRQRAEAAAAADIGNLEPDAFLGANAHHHDVAVPASGPAPAARPPSPARPARPRRHRNCRHAAPNPDASRSPAPAPSGRVRAASYTDWRRRRDRSPARALRPPWSPWHGPAARPRRRDRATRPAHPARPGEAARTAPPSRRAAPGRPP